MLTNKEPLNNPHAEELPRGAASFQPASRKLRVALVLLICLLFIGTLIPGTLKAGIEQSLWHILPWSALAHAVLFCAIAALPVYGKGKTGVLRTVLLALLLACLTETLQRWVPGRHPLWRDVGIDLAGAVVGMLARYSQITQRFFPLFREKFP